MKWSIPEKTIDLARDEVKAGRVVAVEADPVEQVWHAEVLGSQLYHVRLDGTTKEQDVCTCEFWQEKGYCKHTVAVELALRADGKNRVLKQNRQEQMVVAKSTPAQWMIRSFGQVQQKQTHHHLQKKTPLEIEWLAETVVATSIAQELAQIGIRAKIGTKESGKRYVIKNIHEFLAAWRRKGAYEIRPQETVYLERKNINGETQLFLDRLAKLEASLQSWEKKQQTKAFQDKRYVFLPADVALDTLRAAEEQPLVSFQLLPGTTPVKQMTLADAETEPVLHFRILPKGEQALVVKVEEPELYYLKEYHWVTTKQTLYPFNQDQEEIYKAWLQLKKRMHETELLVEQVDFADFYAVVVPMFEKIGQVKDYAQAAFGLIQAPLKTVMFMEKLPIGVKVRVDSWYGETCFSSDSTHSSERSLQEKTVRQPKQEARTAEVLHFHQFLPTPHGWQKIIQTAEDWVAFFKETVPFLREYAEVRLSPELEAQFLTAEAHTPHIRLAQTEDSWLAIQFDVSSVAEDEVNEVLQSLLQEEEYHVLRNGQILELESAEFFQTSQALQQIRDNMRLTKGQWTVPSYQAVQVEKAFAPLAEEVVVEDQLAQMITALRDPASFEAVLPQNLQAEMRPYQQEGMAWLQMLTHYQLGGILADDMGLGKTLQTIAFLLAEKQQGRLTEPVLIVAPASLLFNWQAEVRRFAPELGAEIVIGDRATRQALLAEYRQQKVEIVITSYASLRQDEALYAQEHFQMLIMDEAQMVKNVGTKTFRTIKNLPIHQRFALSGTPIENKIDELWALFQLLMPGFFPPKRIFQKMEVTMIRRMIQPFVLRREKADVLLDLPEKVESNLLSTLTQEQKTLYLAQLRQMQQQLAGMKGQDFQQNRMAILAGLTRLRQICCDPALFVENYEGTSGKVEQLLEMMEIARKTGRRVLIFSQFTKMLEIIQTKLAEKAVATFYLHGGTPPKDRLEMVNDFNAGERDAFLISLKAGGTGLNLTGADTVILFDLWWNPAVEEQAAGRAHRIGQKKTVEVWRMMAEGTIEERIYQLQQEKRQLFDQLLGTGEAQTTSLTEEDIRSILQGGEEWDDIL